MRQDVANGIPMIRSILQEYPNEQPRDKTNLWELDEFMLGSSLLVIPLLESSTNYQAYFPKMNNS